MTIYVVSSAFTSRPVTLVASGGDRNVKIVIQVFSFVHKNAHARSGKECCVEHKNYELHLLLLLEMELQKLNWFY